jgi:hypothetical protein
MKALIVNSQVLAVGAADVTDTAVLVNGVVFPLNVIGDYSLIDAVPAVTAGWTYANGEFVAPASLPTVDQYVAAMDANFDAKAAEKNYDSRITCALRAGYAGPFQAEGIAFAQWMDGSYAAAYLILAAVQAGERPAPETTDALLAELPQFDWANV